MGSENNFFWLTGDRFVCVERKKEIIKKFRERRGKDCSVKYIDEEVSVDILASMLKTHNLFGSEDLVVVIDGKMPDPKKSKYLLENLPDNKIVILIQESVDGRSSEYKNFKEYIEEYPLIWSGKIPDKKAIGFARNLIKGFLDWKNSDDLFEVIFSTCDFDYGKTVNEIVKLKTYFGGEIPESLEEVKSLIPSANNPQTESLMDCIKKKDKKKAIEIFHEMELSLDINEYSMMFLYALLEQFTFLFFCCAAYESGYKDRYSVADFIVDNKIKKGEVQDRNKVANRLYYYEDIYRNNTSEYYALGISAIEEAMKSCILDEFSHHFSITKLLNTIC